MPFLIEKISHLNRPPVIPLMGINGIKLTGTTIKQNLTDAEAQLETLSALHDTFRPDGMFVLMDLTVEAEALGLPLRFEENDTPSVAGHDVKSLEDLERVKAAWSGNGGRMDLFTEVVRKFSARNDGLTGAYVIGPFTLAGEMMGSSDLTMNTILEPDLVKAFLEFSVSVITDYTKRLFDAGADMVCVLEPTAMMISPDQFEIFSLNPFKRIQENVDHKPLILHICGNTNHLIEKMATSGAAGLSLDWQVDMEAAIRTIPEDMLLIGNLDPVQVFLQGNPDSVRSDTSALLEKMKPYKNFVASSGCDLPLETPEENLSAFMDVAVSDGCRV